MAYKSACYAVAVPLQEHENATASINSEKAWGHMSQRSTSQHRAMHRIYIYIPSRNRPKSRFTV